MTSRERILASLRHESVDRVPVSPFGLGHLDPESQAAAELIQRTDPFLTAGLSGNAFMGEAVQAESRQDGDETLKIGRAHV